MQYRTWKDYKTTQNSLTGNAHDKIKISVIINMWTKHILIFSIMEAQMTKQSQGCHFVPVFYWEVNGDFKF